MALIELKVPDIGDTTDAAVIEILLKPGDTVKAEQSLITLESDKASMEVPASQGGVLKEIRLKLGDKVSQGAVIGMLEVAADAASDAPAAPAPAPAKANDDAPSAGSGQAEPESTDAVQAKVQPAELAEPV